MKYFESTDSLFDITEKYPVTRKVFIDNGFVQIADDSKRSTFGKALQLSIALAMRQLDDKTFVFLLEEAIEKGFHESETKKNADTALRIKGLLPCPVRIPLQEGLDTFLEGMIAEGAAVTTQ